MLAVTTAMVLLYFKLPDSIRSGVSRSAHDFYVKAKKHELKELKGIPKAAAAGASHGTPASEVMDDTTDADSGDDAVPAESTEASASARVARKAARPPRWTSVGFRLGACAPAKRVPKPAAPQPEADAGVVAGVDV